MRKNDILVALRLWRSRDWGKNDRAFWEEILGREPSLDLSDLAFLRNLLLPAEETDRWLARRVSWPSSVLLLRRRDDGLWVGGRRLDEDLLREWNQALVGSHDARLHRRMLRPARKRSGEGRPYLSATLEHVLRTYPMTGRARDFLARWAKEVRPRPPRSRGRTVASAVLLGIALALLAGLLAVVARRGGDVVPPPPPAAVDPKPAETSALSAPAATPLPPESSRTLPEPQARRYRVRPGDVLWRIAREQVGPTARWQDLQRLNPDLLANPDYLEPGWELVLPPVQGMSQ